MIPCHRAVRSDGTLGGYQGGLKMKRSLLEMEGVSFNASGRVVTKEFFYRGIDKGLHWAACLSGLLTAKRR